MADQMAVDPRSPAVRTDIRVVTRLIGQNEALAVTNTSRTFTICVVAPPSVGCMTLMAVTAAGTIKPAVGIAFAVDTSSWLAPTLMVLAWS